MNIFIGSLPFSTKESDLREFFEAYGEVSSAAIISDKYTGRSRGFGFVEMPDKASAQKAIEELNGSQVDGRAIVVKEAIERDENSRRSSNSGEYRPRRDNGYNNRRS